MKAYRQDRRAIKKAVRKALKTGRGSCELIDGTTIVFTQDCCVSCLEAPDCLGVFQWNQMIEAQLWLL